MILISHLNLNVITKISVLILIDLLLENLIFRPSYDANINIHTLKYFCIHLSMHKFNNKSNVFHSLVHNENLRTYEFNIRLNKVITYNSDKRNNNYYYYGIYGVYHLSFRFIKFNNFTQ